jgi:hypothetical protein
MQIFTITDPHNRENPLAELSIAESVMYHGTHSMFSSLIEKQGFRFDGFDAAFGAAIRTIVAACDELYFKPDGYGAAAGFSDKKFVYFSASFRSARGYAINVGGERIDGALRAANAFVAFARAPDRVERQAAHWEAVLKQYGPHRETERILANLRNAELVRELPKQVENAYSVLSPAVKQGHPVVYAVRVDRKWVSLYHAVMTGEGHAEPFGGISQAEVTADRIVARIDYPNSISPNSE